MYLGWRGVSRVAAPVPGRPGSVAGGHVREPYTVFNAERAAAGRSRASRHMIQNLRCEGCLERGGGRRSDSSQPSPIRDKGTCRGPRPGCAVALAAVRNRIVSTVSFVLAMSIRPRAPHGRVGSRRPATRHSTPHTGHGGPSPSAVRPGGVASFALRGLPVPPSLAFAVYTLGIRFNMV